MIIRLKINAHGVAMNSIDFRNIESIKQFYISNPYRFNVISLFAGGGGSSTGYRMSGGNVLLVNEFIEEARNTYRLNWPLTKIIPNDIRTITGNDILSEIGMGEGEIDLLDGSPPCSAFSTSGSRERGWNKNKKYSDTVQGNIQDLFFDYIRILRVIKPRVFVAENVVGLAIGKAKGYFNIILRELRLSGYHVEVKKLDASRLGVPQTRNRLIFIGVRADCMKSKYINNLHPKKFSYKVNLLEAFDGLTLSDRDIQQTDIRKYKIYQYLKELIPGQQHIKIFNLIKANPFSVCPCITAKTGCLSAACPKHWDNRAFTISEIKRIMSLPDNYVLTGDYSKQVERMGRMVPPFMMKAVADNLLDIGVL